MTVDGLYAKIQHLKKNHGAAYWAGLGFAFSSEIVGAGLVGYLLGSLLDEQFSPSIWFRAALSVFFVLLALIHIVRQLIRLNKEE